MVQFYPFLSQMCSKMCTVLIFGLFIARPISPEANNVADFDMDGKPDNISFMIKRIKVHTEDALEDPSYRFPGNYGVEKFLEIFSGWSISNRTR